MFCFELNLLKRALISVVGLRYPQSAPEDRIARHRVLLTGSHRSQSLYPLHISHSNMFSRMWRRVALTRQMCTAAAEESAKSKKCRRKNLVEVASYLPDKGLGHKFTRLLWLRNGYENSYWTISRVVEKGKGRLRYYGKLTWRGAEEPRERKVSTWQKRGWRYILDGDRNHLGSIPGISNVGTSTADRSTTSSSKD